MVEPTIQGPGQAQHASGYSAQGLEDLLGAVSDRLRLQGQFFSTPTSLNAAFGPEGRQQTHLLRVQPGAVNLGRLTALEQVAIDVAHGRCTPAEGTAAIDRIVAAPSPYGRAVTTLAYGLASGAACQFLGGGAREIEVALVLGLGLGLIALLPLGSPRLRTVFEPLSAFLISAAAIGLAHLVGPFSVLIATLAGLIILLPGLTLTTAISELATGHLNSGTLRLSGAFITFLSLGFGMAFGNRVAVAALGQPPVVEPAALPGWTTLVAVVVASITFSVILGAERRDVPFIVGAGALGVIGGRVGAMHLGVEMGAFAGSFAVALASGFYERWLRRPASVVLVPGILMLVPGSVGFRSLMSLMDREAMAGLETAFSMMLTAVALVAGLLIAGTVAPEHRVRRDVEG